MTTVNRKVGIKEYMYNILHIMASPYQLLLYKTEYNNIICISEEKKLSTHFSIQDYPPIIRLNIQFSIVEVLNVLGSLNEFKKSKIFSILNRIYHPLIT